MLQEKVAQSFSYQEFRDNIEQLVAKGKTTGPNQTEQLAEFTKLNQVRMNRLEKTTELKSELATALDKIERKQIWLMLVEAWCGDVAQNLPMINKMAESAPNVELRLLLRDENLDLMDQYLTNGGRSIPKMVMLDAASFEEIDTWGPRPAPVQKMMMDFKANPNGVEKSEFLKTVQLWYAKDKTHTLQQEFLDRFKN